MIRVTFVPSQIQRDVTPGANLMEVIQEADLPIGSSCGAVAVCAKCSVKVISGMENLSKPNPIEVKLKEREKFGAELRISCLTKIMGPGPVTITTGYW